MGVLQDITERKKAEKALKESEVKYRTLVEQAADAIALFNDSGKILDVNTGSVNLLGYSREELIKMNLTDVLTAEEIKTKPIQYEVLQKGESTIKQRMMRRKDGSVVQTEVRSQRLPDGRFLSVIRDLTERIKAQEQIEKEKELSDSIINNLPGIFYLYDSNGKFLRWNKNLEKISGYNAKEIKKMYPLDFYDEDEKERMKERIKSVFNRKIPGAEVVLFTKKRKKIPLYISSIAIIYEGRKCLMGMGIDISDRKKAEQELDESYKAIRRLMGHLQTIREEERAHMAREIHDELGQQLTVLKMDVSWLNKKIGITADDKVKKKMKDLLELLNGTVKTVRRISSELRPSLLDDLGLVAAIEWQLTEFEKHSGIKTSFSEPGVDVKLSNDKKINLFRILQESLTNVARHAEATLIKVSLMNNINSFVLQISDNGKGFDKLRIAGKRTLGILGMKERTAMIGGTYEITGMPGKGTTVLVTVPPDN
jgi:PAS domain S-box-containing protein